MPFATGSDDGFSAEPALRSSALSENISSSSVSNLSAFIARGPTTSAPCLQSSTSSCWCRLSWPTTVAQSFCDTLQAGAATLAELVEACWQDCGVANETRTVGMCLSRGCVLHEAPALVGSGRVATFLKTCVGTAPPSS